MSDGPVLGIDLGTTNSVVAVADGGQARVLADAEGRRIVPSVVSFLPDGPTLVGYEARERRLLDAANTVYAVKRLIGRPFASPEVTRARERFAFEIVPNKHGGSVVKVARGTYALAEISAMVLRELRRTAELNLGMNAERAVITVPANFNELQRSATKAAGKVAGLEVLRILNEPTAAALAYGYGSGGNNERIAVYDLGGGTFDITILELEDDVFEVLSTAGDTFLGGEDIDRAVAEVMSDRFREEHGIDPRRDPQAYERLKAAAEWAKCQLSSEPVVELTIEELVIDGGGRNLDLYFAMTRRELEDLVRPWIERSLTVVDGALSEAGVTVFDLDSVLLVGGSTRMPLCRNMVTEHFRREPRIDIDPDMVVAQGAAIHAYALGGSTARVELPREVPRPPSPRKTDAGVPRQPAFAPDEVSAAPPPPRRPARKTTPPPAVPDLPPPVLSASVLISPAVEVRPRKTSIELELDDLAPPPMGSDPFAQIEADDPFAAPRKGGMARLPMPAIETALDTPFEIEAHSPEQRSVAKTTGGPWTPPEMIVSREPTQPFATERQNNDHARTLVVGDVPEPPPPPKPPPPPPAARRPTDPALARTAMWAQPPLPAPDITNAARPVRDPAIAFDVARPPPQPVVAMPERAPPLLMDVTPHSLGIETAGGFVKKLITKNAPVPTEQSRTFTTARDDQREVVVRVCQGENDRFSDNQELGEVILDHLPPHPRGALSIDVAFILDADGTLAVEARDAQSGRVQRTRIQLRGGLSADEIEAMRARHRTERFR